MIADFFEISQKLLTSLFYGAAAPGSGGVRTAGTLTPALLGLIPEFFFCKLYIQGKLFYSKGAIILSLHRVDGNLFTCQIFTHLILMSKSKKAF